MTMLDKRMTPAEIVAQLQKVADAARADLGDSTSDIRGKGQRAPGRFEGGKTAASK